MNQKEINWQPEPDPGCRELPDGTLVLLKQGGCIGVYELTGNLKDDERLKFRDLYRSKVIAPRKNRGWSYHVL